MNHALEVAGLATGYGTSKVVNEVSLHLDASEILAVVGKNGMGKTSLLKAIIGFLPAWDGTVKLAGSDVTRTPPYQKRKRGLVYVPQEQALFQDLTVHENLRLGVLRDRELAAELERIRNWFPVLLERFHQRAGTLSGGEQKMLIVSRALMARPRVLLLDEVTEGLQPSVVDRVARVLTDLRRDAGTAILVVEQHLPFALGIADRYLVFKRGEVVDSAPVTPESAARIDSQLQI